MPEREFIRGRNVLHLPFVFTTTLGGLRISWLCQEHFATTEKLDAQLLNGARWCQRCVAKAEAQRLAAEAERLKPWRDWEKNRDRGWLILNGESAAAVIEVVEAARALGPAHDQRLAAAVKRLEGKVE